jgi:hypothetical protein
MCPISSATLSPVGAIVRGNIINQLYNGISMSNFGWAIPASASLNVVTLQQATSSLTQKGIEQVKCSGSGIDNNSVTSTGNFELNDNARAVYTGMNGSTQILCNTESNMGRGFEFAGTQVNAGWFANTMQTNKKGFVLDNSWIGPQGAGGFWGMPSFSAGHQWLGTWSGTKYNTYTNFSLPINSTLYFSAGFPVMLPGKKEAFR